MSKLKKFIPFTKEWCAWAAELEKDSSVEVGGGMKVNISPEDLAPLVEKIADKMVEDINSSGVVEQLKFLENNGWDKSAVVKYLLDDDNA